MFGEREGERLLQPRHAVQSRENDMDIIDIDQFPCFFYVFILLNLLLIFVYI